MSPFEPAIYIKLPAWEAAYNDAGKQLTPFPIRVVEDDLEYASNMLTSLLISITLVKITNNLLLLTPSSL